MVRTELYSTVMKPREKLADLIEKFKAIFRSSEMCENFILLTEEEKRSTFVNAVLSASPELVAAEVTK